MRGMSSLKRMSERTRDLQCAVIDEFRARKPSDDAEAVLWHELLRAQTSLATNSAESDGAHFILKFQIALKEARESFQLLKLLRHACPDRPPAPRRAAQAVRRDYCDPRLEPADR